MNPTITAGSLRLTWTTVGLLLVAACHGRESTPRGQPAFASTPRPMGSAIQTLQRASTAATLAQKVVVEPTPSVPEPKRPSAEDRDSRPGLTAELGEGKIPVEFPLKHTRVYAQVAGNVARVEVTQLYQNPSPDRLEAVYAFPLPANAAVTDMYFRIGKRVVFSEVKKREEAKRTYEKAKAEGKTAALTEQERPNLFTQSVANIPPGETVAVVLRYVHEVPYDDGRYLYVFPTTVGPRYIPGDAVGKQAGGWSPDTNLVPDASRVTPPVLPPPFRSAHDIDIVVRLTPGTGFTDLATRSHRIVTGLDGEGGRLVSLAEDDRIPNKDFVLAYRPAGAEPEAHVLVQREKGDDYLMLFVQPPVNVAEQMVRPKEMVFLLDRSGSMSGAPIETAKKVMLLALRHMGSDDTFQIVAFDGSAEAMSPAPLPNTPANVARAEDWLQQLHGGGGTEMLTGIVAALAPSADPRRLRMVVFCTDGFIGNEAQIIEAVEKTRGTARVFGFGIGSSVNRYLIDGVARAGRGAAEVVTLRDKPEETVDRLFKRLDRPVLTDLEVSFEGVRVADLMPERLPDLFAGQPLVAVGRVAGSGPAAVTLHGLIGTEKYQRRIPLQVRGGNDEVPVLGTLWARRRIDDLSFRNPRGPEPVDVDAIVQLALKFKLITAYTSFVAVERELLADPGLPLTQLLVPNELPEGVSYEGIFGPVGEASAQVLPARVKPGDPEIRVKAGPGARAVRVKLPFERDDRAATWDEASGEFVARFLVPSGWPDGSYEALVTVIHGDGRLEERSVAVRVDTTAAAVSVLSAPAAVMPGDEIALEMKPALPVAKLAGLLIRGAPGGRGHALKGAMELREILVRAPWGEIVRAEMHGPFGTYRARLHAPQDAAGIAHLEIVASDAAGNVSRRSLDVEVGPRRSGAAWRVAGVSLAAAQLAGFGLVLRRRRAARGARRDGRTPTE